MTHYRIRPIVLLLALGCASEPTPVGYYEAMRAVRLSLKTVPGVTYNRVVHDRTRNAIERLGRRCFVREAPDARGARVLYLLDAQGRPVRSIAHPPSPFAECVREGLASLEPFELPPPPRANYWIHLPAPHPDAGRD